MRALFAPCRRKDLTLRVLLTTAARCTPLHDANLDLSHEERARELMSYAISLGADPATWNRCQLVRLPGGVRTIEAAHAGDTSLEPAALESHDLRANVQRPTSNIQRPEAQAVGDVTSQRTIERGASLWTAPA
jgi:hypothetical protein